MGERGESPIQIALPALTWRGRPPSGLNRLEEDLRLALRPPDEGQVAAVRPLLF